jgi:hypothetical protein
MPIGYHHFYYSDLTQAVRKAGLSTSPEAALLDFLMTEELAARETASAKERQRQLAANKLLLENYDKLRPYLRPCHQRRFDATAKEVTTSFTDYSLCMPKKNDPPAGQS